MKDFRDKRLERILEQGATVQEAMVSVREIYGSLSIERTRRKKGQRRDENGP